MAAAAATPTTVAPPAVVTDPLTKAKKAKDEIQAQALRDAENKRRSALAATEDQKATKGSVQATLGTGLTSGDQTRGPQGKPLQGSSAERGELIGMRSGVPIYATAESLYGKARPADTPLPKPQAPITTAPSRSNFIAPQEAQGPVRSAETPEQQRAAYQAREAPKAAAAMAPKFFGPQQNTQDPTAAALTRASGVKTALPRGPASQPERTDSMLDDPNNAYSNAAMARTNAAEQKGINDAAIRAGTASQEVRDTNPALVEKIAADTQAMSGLRYKGEEPVSRKRLAIRPASVQESLTGVVDLKLNPKINLNVKKLLSRK
jgi:hypothetical protein